MCDCTQIDKSSYQFCWPKSKSVLIQIGFYVISHVFSYYDIAFGLKKCCDTICCCLRQKRYSTNNNASKPKSTHTHTWKVEWTLWLILFPKSFKCSSFFTIICSCRQIQSRKQKKKTNKLKTNSYDDDAKDTRLYVWNVGTREEKQK